MYAEIRTDGERPILDGRIIIWHAPLDSPELLTDVGAWAGDWSDDGPILTDADAALTARGYDRSGAWDAYDWGYRADVTTTGRRP